MCFMEYYTVLKNKLQLHAIFMWNAIFVHIYQCHKQCWGKKRKSQKNKYSNLWIQTKRTKLNYICFKDMYMESKTWEWLSQIRIMVISCLSLGFYNKNTIDWWLAQQIFTSCSSRSWEILDQDANRHHFWWKPASWLVDNHLLPVPSHGQERSSLSCPFF